MARLTEIIEHSKYLAEFKGISDSEKWQSHLRRLSLGELKTEIWQFIPSKLVEGVWEVLLEPGSAPVYTHSEKYLNDYREAKNAVLFKDWEYVAKWFNTHLIAKNSITGEGQIQLSDYETINDIAKLKPVLTNKGKEVFGI